MNIILNPPPVVTVKLDKLQPGDAFEDAGIIYMVTDIPPFKELPGYCICLNLRTGRAYSFANILVRPVDVTATVSIKPPIAPTEQTGTSS